MGTELIIGAILTAASVDQQKKAQRAQTRARNEDKARNQAQQMQERRQQIREERIKRARVLQAAANTGTSGSSGEAGAVASLGTQLGSNIGFNQGMIESGNRMSAYAQQAADAQGRASMYSQLAGMSGDLGVISDSIFKPKQTKTE